MFRILNNIIHQIKQRKFFIGYLFAFLIAFMSACSKEDRELEAFYSLETVTDIEGNQYRIIKIYNQTWFAENLKTTTFNDGTPINYGADSVVWSSTDSALYCWYSNNPRQYKDVYGALYNWHAVKSEKLCPKGWKVPDEENWQWLVDSLKGENVAGGKMKHSGTLYWTATNTGATNSSGFRALPGGYRNIISEYKNLNDYGFWWSASNQGDSSAWYHCLYYYSAKIYRNHTKHNMGFSVRCVKVE